MEEREKGYLGWGAVSILSTTPSLAMSLLWVLGPISNLFRS